MNFRPISCVAFVVAAALAGNLFLSAAEEARKLNPALAGMGDNSWRKLETPAAHPIARSSSPWMPYVPEAGAGLLWGCSHAGYHNDLWVYGLAQNLWTEKLKTEPSCNEDPGVLKYKDGLLMTREERPLSMHQWGLMDYDPDRKVLWHLGGSWQGSVNIPHTYKNLGKEVAREGDAEKHASLTKTGRLLWKYDLQTNKWSYVYTKDPKGCARFGAVSIRYFPPLKKLIMTPNAVSPNEERERFKAYDPETNTWEPLAVAWKPIDEKVSKYWVWGYPPTVYDAKRKALVYILQGSGAWLLDPVKKSMEQCVAGDKSLVGNLDCPVGAYLHDSVNATTLGIFVDYLGYGGGDALKKRGFPVEKTHVWALDLEKREWLQQPDPSDGVLPPLGMGCVHHYYDPVHNACVLYRGSYNSAATETWVYRYRRAAK